MKTLKFGTCGLLAVNIWGSILGHPVHSSGIKKHHVQLYKCYLVVASSRLPRSLMDLLFSYGPTVAF